MNRISSFFSNHAPWRTGLAALSAALLYSPLVQAALPQVNQVGGSTSGDYMTQIRDYVGLGIGLIALILAGYAFVAVSGGAVAKFNDWRIGKAELGDLKMVFVVGGLLLVVVIFLLTQAVGVIATSGTFAGSTP